MAFDSLERICTFSSIYKPNWDVFYSHDFVIAPYTFFLINIHYSYDIKNILRVHPKSITLCEGTMQNTSCKTKGFILHVPRTF